MTVFARYVDIPGDPAAIACCSCGRGKAILSGAHFEVGPEALVDLNPEVAQGLIPHEKGRRALFREIFVR